MKGVNPTAFHMLYDGTYNPDTTPLELVPEGDKLHLQTKPFIVDRKYVIKRLHTYDVDLIDIGAYLRMEADLIELKERADADEK